MNNISDAYLEDDDNFYDTSNGNGDGGLSDMHSSGQLHGTLAEVGQVHMSEEEKQRQKEEWQQDLIKTEEEIQTLRHVLSSKLRYAADLKRRLGISTLTEMRQDLQHGLENIKSMESYQKTAAVVRVAKDKTSNTLTTATSKVSEKWSFLKNSNTYKSFEGKVGTAYSSIKSKLGSSGTASTTSHDSAANQPSSGDPTNQSGATV